MELKNLILDGTLRVFHRKGLKFTMDDLAKELSMSKKTIYTIFPDKESLFFTMVEHIFDRIKESEQAIIEDTSLPTLEKIHKILGVLPEGYQNVDLQKLYPLKEKYPKIYREVESRLENGWEPTLCLLEQGMKEGVIRPVPLSLVKMMLEASVEQFFQRDVLVRNHLGYSEALREVVEILVYGIAVRNGDKNE